MKWLKITKIYASVCAFCIVSSEIYRFLNTFLLKNWFIVTYLDVKVVILCIIFDSFKRIWPTFLCT